jgi:nitrate reductase cytochrome c-type subunit
VFTGLKTVVTAIEAGVGIWASLTFWKAMAMIIRVQMLMYGKEASNRKQETDRQHHTIPNQRNQRPKNKHYGIPLIPHIKEYKF